MDQTSEMELGCKYSSEDLGLSSEVQTLCHEIEEYAGQRIIFIYSPMTAEKWFGRGTVETAACIVTECEAVVVSVLPRLTMRTIYHELLHVRLAWVSGQRRLWTPTGAPGLPFSGWGNDLEHLQILREERAVFAGDDFRDHWRRHYGNPLKFEHVNNVLSKRNLVIGWAVARLILEDASKAAWEEKLMAEEIWEDANGLTDKLTSVGDHLGEKWRVVLREFRLPGDFCFRQIDIKTQTARVSPIEL